LSISSDRAKTSVNILKRETVSETERADFADLADPQEH
jgi:hypothetical protein